jgi:hypothetical protein
MQVDLNSASVGRVHGLRGRDSRQARVALAGELIVNTVTEESTGAGGLVSARTLQADAAIVPETDRARHLDRLPRKPAGDDQVEGHAGIAPRHPDGGGAVNAIEVTNGMCSRSRRLRSRQEARRNTIAAGSSPETRGRGRQYATWLFRRQGCPEIRHKLADGGDTRALVELLDDRPVSDLACVGHRASAISILPVQLPSSMASSVASSFCSYWGVTDVHSLHTIDSGLHKARSGCQDVAPRYRPQTCE